MSAQRIWPFVCISLCLGISLATAQSRPAATSPATAKADMAPFVAAIDSAATVDAAVSAYDRGTAVDRGNLELNLAYLKKMLKLGQPQIAWYPAQVVLGHSPNDSLALGVAGYFYGTRNNFANALVSTVCAAGFAPDNQGILHNAGLLVAWYDFDPNVGPIPYAGRCSLQRLRERLQANSTFHQAYEQVHTALLNRQKNIGNLDDQIRAAEPQVDELRRKAFNLDAEMRQTDMNLRVKQMLQPSFDPYQRDLPWMTFGNLSSLNRNDYGFGIRHLDPFSYGNEAMGQQVYQQQAATEVIRERDKYQGLNLEAQTVMAELRQRQGHLNDLRRQRDVLTAAAVNVYTFMPPAVDGVVVPAAAPVSLAARPGAHDPEVEAQYRLELAKLFLSNNMPSRAISTLKDMLASYPKTKAAVEARSLLRELKS